MSKKTDDTLPVKKRSTFQEPDVELVKQAVNEATEKARAAQVRPMPETVIVAEGDEDVPDDLKIETTTQEAITTDERDESIRAERLATEWSDESATDFGAEQEAVNDWARAADAVRMEALSGMTLASAEELVEVARDTAREHEKRARRAEKLADAIAVRLGRKASQLAEGILSSE